MLPARSVTMAVASVLVVTMATSLAVEKEVNLNLEKRILNGKVVPHPAAHPYMVALMYHTYFVCGGALIYPYWVLTAAHCVQGLSRHNLKVVAGQNNLVNWYNTGVWSGVTKVFYHPGYNDKAHHDIALLKLATPIFQNGRNIGYATLPWFDNSHPALNNLPVPGQTCLLMGWGYHHIDANFDPLVLQEVHLTVTTYEECRRHYWHLRSDTQTCAVDYDPHPVLGHKGTCKGDSGGPMMCGPDHGILAGIISYGRGRCDPKHIGGVYTRVSSYLGWMVQVIELGRNLNCLNDCRNL